MAFFGLQWVPQLEKSIRASEADEAQMAGLAYTIREKGREATTQQATDLYQKYNTEYYALPGKQQEATQWRAYMQNQFAALPPKEVDLIQKAAIAWRGGDNSYYEHYQNLSSDESRNLVGEYYQMLDAIAAAEQVEADLWNLSAESQNAQRISELWAFEAQNAINQQEKLRQRMKEEKRKRKDLIRANEKHMALLRKMNKAKARQRASPGKGEKTASTLKPGDAAAALGLRQTRQKPITPMEEEAASVLSGLDKISIKPTSPTSTTTKKPEKGLLSEWFGPKMIEEKDFL